MSGFDVMRTSTSGMFAQVNRLGTIGDNIANATTTGYKHASTEFSALIPDTGESDYVPGGVDTRVRYAISQQGSLRFTTSVTDLAVNGNGFFVVSGGDPTQTYLTRAGSFVKDGEGNLVNAAGYKLMGNRLTGAGGSGLASGTGGLQVVNLAGLAQQALASTSGSLSVNLPSNAQAVSAANLPSTNSATATYTAKTSLVAYDTLGNRVTLDVYATKVSDNTWEMAVYDHAAAGSGGAFPYSSGPLTTTTLAFDATTGQLATASPTSLSIPVPNGAVLTLDMSQTTQLAADFTVLDAKVDGNAAGQLDRVEIDKDGTLFAVYDNGARVAAYQIPLATVNSPDNLRPLAGNVYAPDVTSGDIQVGTAGQAGLGTLASSALEQSTVDLATELTTMIEAQRSYGVNSKAFQTGNDLLEALSNLKI